MPKEKIQFYFLLIILAVVLIIAGLIFHPFFNAVVMAIVFAVISRPLYQKIIGLIGNREGVSALFTSILVVIVVVVPFLLLGTRIFQESQNLYSSLANGGGQDSITNILGTLTNSLESIFPSLHGFSLDLDISQYLKETLNLLINHLGVVFSSVAKIIANLFIFLIALYYALKDGPKLKKFIVELSPLPDTDDERIFKKLALAIHSVIKGSLAVAFIQGVIAATGFAFFGVPNAVLWGTVTAIAALIPGIGTALVLIPVILFLFISGQTVPAIGMLIWSITAVGLIDNFLGPKLVSHGTELHPLIIFISVLGGIMFFGPLGFLLGPLTMSLLLVLIDIYSQAVKTR